MTQAVVQERAELHGRHLAVRVDGREKRFDMTDVHPEWLHQVAELGLRDLLAFGSRIKAMRTVNSYLVAVRNFSRYMVETDAAMTSAQSLTPEIVDHFEAWLRVRYTAPSQEPFMQTTRVIYLLRGYARTPGMTLPEGLLLRLERPAAGPVGATQPLDSYSPFVTKQLRDAASADILAAVERLQEGEALVRQGMDPEVHGWDRANLAWLAANRGPLVYRSLIDMAWPGLVATNPVGPLNRAVFLTQDDVLAFWIRLGLDTGLPIESIKSLRADCLINADRRWVHVRYIKRRRHGHEHNTRRIRDGGPNTPGGLLRLAINLTETARRLTGSEDLWVGYSKYGLHTVNVFATGPKTRVSPVNRFASRHDLRDDNGQPLRLTLSRLRKTRKAEHYALTRGDVAAVADDHSAEVSASRYGNVPSMGPVLAQSVQDGLQQALDAALPRTILSGVDPEQAAVDIDETPETVRAVLAGERDVWVTNCGDFFNSPFGQPGKGCPVAVWGCFQCANSIVTSDRLPAIIAFRAHAESQRPLMPDDEWSLMYAAAIVRIEQILDRFPGAQVRAAQLIAETVDATLFVPPQVPGVRARRGR